MEIHNPFTAFFDAFFNIYYAVFNWAYSIWQVVLSKVLSPAPPPPNATLSRPRIAIVGAGLTGVSAAAHCVGHGFDVQIFEGRDSKNLGGIWSRVNNTSGLQIHSVMYRFHPSVTWTNGYPSREQIVGQIRDLWHRYGLDEKTKFNTPVENVFQDKNGRWIVNDVSNGRFDGVIAAVGTCGDAKMPHLPNDQEFGGQIYHSSELDGKDMKGKKVLIIGGGASAVEALEYATHAGAAETKILSRVSYITSIQTWLFTIHVLTISSRINGSSPATLSSTFSSRSMFLDKKLSCRSYLNSYSADSSTVILKTSLPLPAWASSPQRRW
jgi:Pyridine nucleotide-disulphide oxidoreductase